METTGQFLKNKLGLSKFSFVSICRVLVTTYKVYYIFYDSRRPFMPITSFRALRGYTPAFLFKFPFDMKAVTTPLTHLEEFNGPVENALFFVIDLSGKLGDTTKLDFILENAGPKANKRLVELTVGDLATKSSMSDLTAEFRKERNKYMHGSENVTAKLVDVQINTAEDWVNFQFLTEVTQPAYPEDYAFQEVDPKANFEIIPNPSLTYEIDIRFTKFFSWMKTYPVGSELTPKDLKDMMDVSDVQIWSNAPSFTWQGMNYMLSQMDASIHPIDIAPQFWNRPDLHGSTYFLDKHTYGLLSQFRFFMSPMASMLNKKLRQQGII